ncbi:MAG TPA: hypothetical protein VLT45_04205 [Kofleriaceae bacterium]|nr:hypothetical protein [Kofleriaceae bacterium]
MLTLHIIAIALRALFVSGADAPAAVNELPEECRPFAVTPSDVRDDTFGWNQLLSLASCIQDNTVMQVTDEAEVELMVDRYRASLYIPLLIYVGVLENAPGPMQLHAAYHVGMAYLTMAVRARRSVASPALRAKLEPLLQPSLRLAAATFAVIDRVADEDPGLVTDEVARNEVRSARALLRLLPRPFAADRVAR